MWIKDKTALWLFPSALLSIFIFSVLTIWRSHFIDSGHEVYAAYIGVIASGILALICVRPFTRATVKKLRS